MISCVGLCICSSSGSSWLCVDLWSNSAFCFLFLFFSQLPRLWRSPDVGWFVGLVVMGDIHYTVQSFFLVWLKMGWQPHYVMESCSRAQNDPPKPPPHPPTPAFTTTRSNYSNYATTLPVCLSDDPSLLQRCCNLSDFQLTFLSVVETNLENRKHTNWYCYIRLHQRHIFPDWPLFVCTLSCLLAV